MFKLVHALRGIAAMWVLLFHASEGGHIDHLKASLPDWADYFIFRLGDCGDAIFFALSGFVIAHSLRGAKVDAGFVGRFAFRRALRLDPPYWIAIAFVIGLQFISADVKGEVFTVPSGFHVGAHLLYLQTLLQYEQINPAFWTLTYEIQFYLVLASAIGIAQRFGITWVAVPLAVVALAWGTGLVPTLVPGLFVNLWHSFAIGALAYWAIEDGRAAKAMIAMTVVLLFFAASIFTMVSVLTAVALFTAGRTGYLMRGLDWRVLQWLGTISYSLYLTHSPVTGAAFHLTARVGLAEWIALPLVVAGCVGFAAAFWWAIERPSQALAKRVHSPQKTSSGAVILMRTCLR